MTQSNGPVREALVWQPIEAAPRDGTHILATLPDSDTCYVICWADPKAGIRKELGKRNHIGWRIAYNGYPLPAWSHPETWMPLPDTRPAQAAARQDEPTTDLTSIIRGTGYVTWRQANEIASLVRAALAQAPQAVPLSEERIAKAVRPLYADTQAAAMGLLDDIQTTRAIEAAHGITGQASDPPSSLGAPPSGTACSVASLPAPEVAALRVPPAGACGCRACSPNAWPFAIRMILCPTCGNKRCPHANDHRNACTGSNEPGQPGSAYPLAARGIDSGEAGQTPQAAGPERQEPGRLADAPNNEAERATNMDSGSDQ